jgi:hypothetical protein
MDANNKITVVTVRKGTAVKVLGVFDQSPEGTERLKVLHDSLMTSSEISSEVMWRIHEVMLNVEYQV